MKAYPFLSIFLLWLVTITITGIVFAQTETVGVSPGNTFEYNYAFSWESTNSTAEFPPQYSYLRDTQQIQITIKSITGTIVNLDITRHYINGTERTWNGDADLNNQVITVPYGFLIIRSNANPKESIYPSGGHATLNETSMKTYPVGEIETIHYLSVDTSAESHESTEIYFHRATGAAAEFQYESQETSGSYSTTIRESMILQRSNVELRPSFPISTALIIVIPIVIFVVCLVIWLRRRRIKPEN